ncbi:hexon assembly protein 100K [Bat mastadenovirus]|uniref:Shutoff protein n=1 Tax=Bat mastadenovirus TaxID=740971 RepID=A0A3G9F1D7_9ADEN|nr:hexon assembly protein 100K [Bat mastadenovirus]BBE29316.1 hexon assembly protein 100K [Bat mastadenovirus]
MSEESIKGEVEEIQDDTLTAPPNSPVLTSEPLDSETAVVSDLDSTEPLGYLNDDLLHKHLQRQSTIVLEALQDRLQIPTSVAELSCAYERSLFSPIIPPRKQENGTCEANPRLNFYPTFVVPETLATYHIFFTNQKIPLSCRANRPRADRAFTLQEGDCLPDYETMDTVSRVFEGLGSEDVAEGALENTESMLVELKNDNPRLAVAKRSLTVTHFAYPALHLPPKVLTTMMDTLLVRRAQPKADVSEINPEDGKEVVSDSELSKWLKTDDQQEMEQQRKTVMGAVLVTVVMECMQRFFTSEGMIKKIGESLHYMFSHGYVALASKISNVQLTNVVTYMGILHENRLGQNVLHTTLKDETQRDYIRDCIFLFLVHSWQTAMGIWQQCLESENLKELVKLLQRKTKLLYTQPSQRLMAKELADIIFPPKLLETFHNGLPDIASQSMMQNFRSFILERSGIVPCVTSLFPTDFIPLFFKECPPTLWPYTYLLKLANYFMYHNDLCYDMQGEGLLEHYCRCNLCTPHRCLATNPAMLNETQLIGTFDMRGPGENGAEAATGLKLTAGVWTSAFLRKFERADYHAHKIHFYENQSKPPAVEPSPCVITQTSILAQLHDIKKAREEFLLKKGQGVYLDPQTGEPLNAADPSVERSDKNGRQGDFKHGRNLQQRGGGGPRKPPRVPGALQRGGGRASGARS